MMKANLIKFLINHKVLFTYKNFQSSITNTLIINSKLIKIRLIYDILICIIYIKNSIVLIKLLL
jgi:hypothetical protein